jgi:hypothetical protein
LNRQEPRQARQPAPEILTKEITRSTEENLSTAKSEKSQRNRKAKRAPQAKAKPVPLHRNVYKKKRTTLVTRHPLKGPGGQNNVKGYTHSTTTLRKVVRSACQMDEKSLDEKSPVATRTPYGNFEVQRPLRAYDSK